MLRRVGRVKEARGLWCWLGAAIIIGACQSAEPDQTPATPNVGGTWTVVRVGDLAAIPMSEPRLQFTNQATRIQGTTGCRSLEGPIAIAGNVIQVGQLGGQAEPRCPPDVREFERTYVEALQSARRIDGGGGRLVLGGPAAEILMVRGDLQLTDEELALAGQLERRAWRVVEATGVPGGHELPAIEFSDGSVLAAGACGYAGRYRLRGEDLIQFYEIAWDAGGDCPPNLQRARSDFSAVLEAVSRISIDATGTTISLRGGDEEATLRAAD